MMGTSLMAYDGHKNLLIYTYIVMYGREKGYECSRFNHEWKQNTINREAGTNCIT
jgi:hypothetical protein